MASKEYLGEEAGALCLVTCCGVNVFLWIRRLRLTCRLCSNSRQHAFVSSDGADGLFGVNLTKRRI